MAWGKINIYLQYNKMSPWVPESWVLPLEYLDMLLTIAAIPLEVTVVGSIVADVLAGLISFLTGDYVGFVMSMLAIAPVVGSFFSVAKIFKLIYKIYILHTKSKKSEKSNKSCRYSSDNSY